MNDLAVIRSYACPRWLYERAQLEPQTEYEVNPSTFENNTPWRWRLVNIAFTSPAGYPAAATDTTGWWARHVNIELGKTGCSDQNMVRTSIAAMCANQFHARSKIGSFNMGADVRLPSPYVLPRDTGLEVRVENTYPGDPDTHLPSAVTFIARGRTFDNKPVILAGESISAISPGTTQTIDSADLFNKGRREIFIDRLIMTNVSREIVHGTNTNNFCGSWISWLVNPTQGTAWMPSDQPIPVGNIAPMSHNCYPTSAQVDRGPRVYYFPPETYLYPRQRMGCKLNWTYDFGEEDPFNLPVHISLFVEMEVM